MTNQEDRNVLKTLSMVIAALTAFFIFSIMAARTVSAEIDPMVEAATIERIKPFGQVNIKGQTPVAATAPVAAASSGADGKAAYSSCAGCHDSGVMGAPKLGDKADWKNRIEQGMDTLFDHAINGFTGKKGTMPAKGGSSLSDDAVKAVVKYMVDSSK